MKKHLNRAFFSILQIDDTTPDVRGYEFMRDYTSPLPVAGQDGEVDAINAIASQMESDGVRVQGLVKFKDNVATIKAYVRTTNSQ